MSIGSRFGLSCLVTIHAPLNKVPNRGTTWRKLSDAWIRQGISNTLGRG